MGTLLTTPAGLWWLVACALKAAVLLGASAVGVVLWRRSTAAARHQLWTLGVVGALVLPVLCWLVPSLGSTAPALLTSTRSFTAAAVLVTPGAPITAAPTWPAWLALAWAAGALVIAVRLARGHLAARRLVHAADPVIPSAWFTAQREAATALGLTRRVQVRRSATIGSPMTIGVVRPRVLLPAAAEGWAPARLRAVLVHELGHVVRHDTAIQLAAQLACALYWWNPLAWLAAARLRIEREHACDDLVLDAGTLPSSYAADLLDVARSIVHDAHTGAICMVDRSWTEARLHRILDATAARRPVRARFRIASCGLALATAVTLACTSAAPPAAAVDPAPVVKPPSRGTLAVGAPFIRTPDMVRPPMVPPPASPHGAIDLTLVAAEVNRRVGDLAACYERRLVDVPKLAGTVVIHWVIDEAGQVPEACITDDTVGDPAVTACVNQLVARGGFPAPQGGAVDVSFPFVFTPAGT